MQLEYREMLVALGALLLVAEAGAQASDSQSADAIDASGAPAGPARLIEVAPEYPPGAAAAGIEGYVDVRFAVSINGRVQNPEVVAAEPAGVFEQAALAAVNRWRYAAGTPTDQDSPVTERISFSLDRSILSLVPQSRTAARARPARNACIREQTRYDFGAEIDISLINACPEPLIVYSCASGTGAYRERWICRDPEQTATLLQSSGSASTAGTLIETPTGLREFSAGRNLELTRAPNSEYWWLACAVDDTNCRDAGRQWVRSVDGQVASVDPQDRTRAKLSRSF